MQGVILLEGATTCNQGVAAWCQAATSKKKHALSLLALVLRFHASRCHGYFSWVKAFLRGVREGVEVQCARQPMSR